MDKKTFKAKELAELTGSKLVGNPDYIVTGYADLESAMETDVSFLNHPRYRAVRYETVMRQSRAGVVFISPLTPLPPGKNVLINEDPSRAFQQAIVSMRGGIQGRTYFEAVHPTAVVHPASTLAEGVSIGPKAVIDAHVSIGKDTHIGAGVYVGPHTIIGEHCQIHPNVTIREGCTLGDHVVIQSGTVIGACGFGFATDENGRHTRIEQIGAVVIEDNVEVGSNCTVDRARFTETRIGKGTKIDNQVVIGHNVKLGSHNLICGQTGIAGSAKTGNHVVIAGQCGIDGHIKLSDGVMVAARSGVTKSLERGKYGGFPALPLEQFHKSQIALRSLGKFVSQIKDIRTRITTLEQDI